MEPQQITTSFTLIEDGTGSGMSIGYLRGAGDKFSLDQQAASALFQLMIATSKEASCIVLWFGEDRLNRYVRGVTRVPPREGVQWQEPIYWKGFRQENEFASGMIELWNADGVRIYAVSFGKRLPEIVSSHFFHERDKKRLGMDYSSNSSKGAFSILWAVIRSILVFTMNLRKPKFREELMNPFRQLGDSKVVKDLGPYIRKGGGGSLELMTTLPNIGQLVAELFAKNGISCEVVTEKRITWG